MEPGVTSIELTVDSISKLAALVAQHGVYALLVLFMFYQQYQARKNLRDAETEKDRDHFRKVHTMTLGAVFTLSALATGVWIYATFMHESGMVAEGTIKDLVDRPRLPSSPDDKPSLVHRLAPFRTDDRLYTTKRLSLEDTYDLDWAFLAPSGRQTMQFRFQQQYTIPAKNDSPSPAVVTDLAAKGSEQPVTGVITRMVKVDLAHPRLAHQKIHIVYRPDPTDPCTKLGTFFVIVDDGSMFAVPFLDEDSVAPPASLPRQAFSFFAGGVAWAAPLQSTSDGHAATPEAVGRLVEYLGSTDLERQTAGQELLLQYRDPIAIIGMILGDASDRAQDRSILIHNVSGTVERFLASGHAISVALSLQLAEELYKIGNKVAAARFYERVPAVDLTQPALMRRGSAYFAAKRYRDAVGDFELYAEREQNPRGKSIALSNAGACHTLLGEHEKAREKITKAISIERRNASAWSNLGFLELKLKNYEAAETAFRQLLGAGTNDVRVYVGLGAVYEGQQRIDAAVRVLEEGLKKAPENPSVLNNLAFYYSKSGENLEQALLHVEKALRLGGERASYLDTKGWILYKLGRHQESVRFLEAAVKANPNDLEIKRHLEEVRGKASV